MTSFVTGAVAGRLTGLATLLGIGGFDVGVTTGPDRSKRRRHAVAEAGDACSVSHCEDVTVVVAASRSFSVGVDLERPDGSALEGPALCAHDENEAQDLWRLLSAKEAAGKAISNRYGIDLDPRQIHIVWDDTAFIARSPHGRTEWSERVRGGCVDETGWIVSLAVADSGDAP